MKKGFVIGVALVSVLILTFSLVSAGFLDRFGITGQADVDIGLTHEATSPNTYSNVVCADVGPTLGGTSAVSCTADISNAAGRDEINLASFTWKITTNLDVDVYTGGTGVKTGDVDATTISVSFTGLNMDFYKAAGNYKAVLTSNSIGTGGPVNYAKTFAYSVLVAIEFKKGGVDLIALAFTDASPSDIYNVNNKGNVEKQIEITGANLVGATYAQSVAATTFAANAGGASLALATSSITVPSSVLTPGPAVTKTITTTWTPVAVASDTYSASWTTTAID